MRTLPKPGSLIPMSATKSGSQIVRLAAAVVHGCHPLLPGRGRPSKAMLYIDSGPPKSVDRMYFYETFTISTSKGSVNLMAA